MNTKQFEAALEICSNAERVRMLIYMEEADDKLTLNKLSAAVKRLAEMLYEKQP